MGTRIRATTRRRRAFLAAFSACGNIHHAACEAGVTRKQVYNWLNDPAFKKEFEEAEIEAIEILEQEIRRRAIEGTKKPVFYRGYRCGYVREYSDSLAMFLARGLKPQKYRENVQVNHGGKISAELKIPGLTQLPTREQALEFLRQQAELMPPAKIHESNGHAKSSAVAD